VYIHVHHPANMLLRPGNDSQHALQLLYAHGTAQVWLLTLEQTALPVFISFTRQTSGDCVDCELYHFHLPLQFNSAQGTATATLRLNTTTLLQHGSEVAIGMPQHNSFIAILNMS